MSDFLDPRDLPEQTSRILVAADGRDLDAVSSVIASLPPRMRGQIFLEVQSAEDIEPLVVPELITVAWLVREVRSGRPGTCEPCAPGVALARATGAWLSEMVTGDAIVDGGAVSAWILGDSEWIGGLREDVVARLGSTSVLTR